MQEKREFFLENSRKGSPRLKSRVINSIVVEGIDEASSPTKLQTQTQVIVEEIEEISISDTEVKENKDDTRDGIEHCKYEAISYGDISPTFDDEFLSGYISEDEFDEVIIIKPHINKNR